MPSLGSGTSRSKGTFGWQRSPEARVGAAVGPCGGSLGVVGGVLRLLGVWEVPRIGKDFCVCVANLTGPPEMCVEVGVRVL